MNDFTKEELVEITMALRFFINRNPDYDTELFEKIGSMMDNYCQINGHNYEFSLGRGQCENCGESE